MGGDCDDNEATTNPNAPDVCDGVDNNCSGDESDATGTTMFYLDLDQDGYGDAGTGVNACEAEEGYVADNTDCDDMMADVYPGADEVCDGVDNDCDGDADQADADFDSSSLITYYADQDQDGFGDDNSAVTDCTQPAGYVEIGGDCNDSRQDLDGDGVFDGAGINPDAVEVYYDGVDADCDGMSDFDQDGDGEDATGVCSDTQYGDERLCELAGACDGASADNEVDCIANGGTWEYNVWTGFGSGTDCNDMSAAVNTADLDGDGYSTCDGDCNEDSEVVTGWDGEQTVGYYTFPGAGFNDPDPTKVGTSDIDGDGYGGTSEIGCLDFYVFDSYGDGWNGNELEIYEDGVYVDSIANQNLDGVSYNGGSGESQMVNLLCVWWNRRIFSCVQ